ncbi:MAG: uracil-DNA glycosylase family protein [Rubinisphaera brasiliensis]|uniref:uracil-DNA glycosylase n=1 Tax=Rubinisphaera brasiliensis TaxID=119 RepID=UPI00391B71DE
MALQRALKQTLETLARAGVTNLPRPGEERRWPLPDFEAAAAQQNSTSTAPPAPQVQSEKSVSSPAPSPAAAPPSRPAASAPLNPVATPLADRTPTTQTPPPAPAAASPEPALPGTSAEGPDSVTRFMNAPVLSRSERESCLASLAERVAGCKRCPELARTRTQTVFGVGNPMAEVMFIGEAPGADEDKQGEPFVGRAGKLLNRIIEACGWEREELYICNILRCRPPGNRNPTPIEASHCREYLDGQIETVNPRFIVCWGTVAAQNLLGVNTPIGRMRGKLYEYGRSQVLCTYHPSYLLRNPSARSLVRDDLQILLKEMGIDPDRLVKKE